MNDWILIIVGSLLCGFVSGIVYERSRVNLIARREREKIRENLHNLGFDCEEDSSVICGIGAITESGPLHYSVHGNTLEISNLPMPGSKPFQPAITGRPMTAEEHDAVYQDNTRPAVRPSLEIREGEEGAFVKTKYKHD